MNANESLKEKIKNDFTAAMKEGGVRLDTLRLLRAALHNREIEKRAKSGTAEITEEEALEIVMREIKKRREAAEMYTQGGRAELATQEKKELNVLEDYLPPQMGEEEIRQVVAEAIKKIGATDAKATGKIMGEAMKTLKGKADSAVVSRIIKEGLGA